MKSEMPTLDVLLLRTWGFAGWLCQHLSKNAFAHFGLARAAAKQCVAETSACVSANELAII